MSLLGKDHSRSFGLAREHELVGWARNDLQDDVVLLLELVFFQWSVGEGDDLLVVLFDCSGLVGDGEEEVGLEWSGLLDDEIEVEVTRVLNEDG